MQNITLAIEEGLLQRGRTYAQSNGTTLNALVRDLLRKTVMPETMGIEGFLALAEEYSVDSGATIWTREEIYDRV